MDVMAVTVADSRPQGSALVAVVRAGVTTALVDGLFSSVVVVLYGSTVTRLWQGVAATLIGNTALNGGTRTVLLGLAMHVSVATTWSAIFVLLVTRSARIRGVLTSPAGMLKVAAVYGPFIWMVMSLVVIPALTQRPPRFTYRWWVQWFGHVPFVGLPIVWSVSRALGLRRPAVTAGPAQDAVG